MARNKLIFEKQQVYLDLLFNRAITSVSNPVQTDVAVSTNKDSSGQPIPRWFPPPAGLYKVNVDVAFAAEDIWGVDGEIMAAAANKFSSFPDSGLAEAIGIRMAASFALDMCFQHVIIESDCKEATDLFNSNCLGNSYQGLVL
ncbi:Reverse transcriptase-like [Sesbania bispinosa]|nr:Reverse transcriptase-like [Sesbania bispinosa]